MLHVLKRLLPRRAKAALKERARPAALNLAARRLARGPLPAGPHPAVLAWLRFGWGNDRFSAPLAYLERIATVAPTTRGAILECGSGVSTVLLAAIAVHQGRQVVSLENDRAWAEHVRGFLARHRLDGVTVVHAPLVDHGEYEWYGVAPGSLPEGIGFVACDGPHGILTRGGRVGLLPVVGSRLLPGAQILLDDAGRPQEQEVLRAWGAARALHLSLDPGAGRGIAHLTLEG